MHSYCCLFIPIKCHHYCYHKKATAQVAAKEDNHNSWPPPASNHYIDDDCHMEFDEESGNIQVSSSNQQCTSAAGIIIGEAQCTSHCTSDTTYSNLLHAFKFPPKFTYSHPESCKYFQNELSGNGKASLVGYSVFYLTEIADKLVNQEVDLQMQICSLAKNMTSMEQQLLALVLKKTDKMAHHHQNAMNVTGVSNGNVPMEKWSIPLPLSTNTICSHC